MNMNPAELLRAVRRWCSYCQLAQYSTQCNICKRPLLPQQDRQATVSPYDMAGLAERKGE